MNFAFCLFKYYPYGGLERNFLRIANACQKKWHNIDVYTMAWIGDKPSNLKLILVPYSGFTNHSRCISFVKNLMNLLNEKQYDAVIGFNRMPNLDVYYAADICFENDVRERHSFLYRLTVRYKTYSKLEKAVFDPDSKTHIMLLSENEKKNFIKYYKTQENRFHLLPPGITKCCIDSVDRNQIRNFYGIPDDRFLLLFIGSDYKRKGLNRSLTAIASLPKDIRKKVLFWVVGKGKPFFYKLKTKILGISEQVKFLGTRDDVPDLLLASDLLLHTAYQENTGNVLLEAIVSGTPVLTTEICGFSFHIKDANAGLVVPLPFKQRKLNKALQEILIYHDHDKLRQNALDYSNTHDLYSRIEKACDIIEKCVLSTNR